MENKMKQTKKAKGDFFGNVIPRMIGSRFKVKLFQFLLNAFQQRVISLSCSPQMVSWSHSVTAA